MSELDALSMRLMELEIELEIARAKVPDADALLARLMELGARKILIDSWSLESSSSGRVVEVSWKPKGSKEWEELQALSLLQGLRLAVQMEEERQKK